LKSDGQIFRILGEERMTGVPILVNFPHTEVSFKSADSAV